MAQGCDSPAWPLPGAHGGAAPLSLARVEGRCSQCRWCPSDGLAPVGIGGLAIKAAVAPRGHLCGGAGVGVGIDLMMT